MQRRFLITCLIFPLIFASCGKKDDVAELKAELEKLKKQNEAVELEKKVAEIKGGRIKGSVFVVTKGGANFKLGLVGVGIADAEHVKTYLAEASKAVSSSVREKKAAYDRALMKFKTANSKFEVVADKYRQSEVVYKQMQEALEEVAFGGFNDTNWEKKYGASDADYSKALVNFIAIDKIRATEGVKIAPLFAKAEAAYDNARSLSYEIDRLTNAQQIGVVLSNFPADQVTKTDAEGAFSFTVDKGKSYVVFASGRREVGNSTEQYYWMVPVSLEVDQDSATVMLSNDNMVDDLLSVVSLESGSSIRELPDFESYMTIVTEPRKWTITDQNGNKRELQIPDITESQPTPVKVVDKTKFPRLGVTTKRITVSTDSGISSVPAGSEIQLIAADGEGYKGTFNSLEFSLGVNDFSEKP